MSAKKTFEALALDRRMVLAAAGVGAVGAVFPSGAATVRAAPSPAELLEALKGTVDAEGLLTGGDIAPRFLPRFLPADRQEKPIAVVRPTSTAEVAAVLGVCHAAGQGVVPQGGMSGLAGGGNPKAADIVVSLERMDGIHELDDVDGTMTVEGGTVLAVAQHYAGQRGFEFGVDIGSRGEATIGGMVSTNAGGMHVVRYGMMRDNVLGLEAVLADGTVVSALSPLIKNNAGYDVKQLFIGSEGTLGIVTKAVLRLRPKPEELEAALVGIDGFDNVPAFLGHLQHELRGMLTAFEVLWADFDAFVREYADHVPHPLKPGHDFVVIVEAAVADPAGEKTRFAAVIDAARRKGMVAEAVVAGSEEERESFWALREQGAAAFGELGPFFGYDVSMRIRDMDAFAQRIKAEIAAAFGGATSLVLGHMGDGNLHVIVAPKSRAPEIHKRADDIVYGAVRDVGGSISAEHGIGTEKRAYLSWSRSDAEIALMRQLKSLLDSKGILNPGKVL